MFDELAFRNLVRKKGKTLTDVAKAIGVATPTLYRKMSGESDFLREEIQECCIFLGEENMNSIFFAKEVT